jgi:sugar phosphate isomerase/epimerase
VIYCVNWPIGVCSWSLRNDFDLLNQLRDQTGIENIHLPLKPAFEGDPDAYLAKVKNSGFQLNAVMVGFPHESYKTLESIKTTGGIVPDQWWPENKKRVLDAIELASRFDAEYLTCHFGFLCTDDEQQSKSLADKMKLLADAAAKKNVMLLMETGQESAEDLRNFLKKLNHPALGVNFDPGNMILYDKGSPVDAVKILAPWIKHIHIKDATRTKVPGTWGLEVPWGDGDVHADKFLTALNNIGFEGAISIEREAGENPVDDVKKAIERLMNFKA